MVVTKVMCRTDGVSCTWRVMVVTEVVCRTDGGHGAGGGGGGGREAGPVELQGQAVE